MNELLSLSLSQARDKLLKKDFTAVELTQAFIQQMADTRSLNAYITETPELAMEQAALSDKRIASGSAGIMEGLPIGMKDLFCTKGTLTTAASKILDNFVPTYESTVSQNLKNAGAVSLGKTNLDEFAMGSGNLTSAFGVVENPWKRLGDTTKLVPGGSSGGSAAAVAARSCLAATATDTGGSIRQPAAFCGLVGIKPTYGRCSRWGVVAFASSLDQAGPLTHTVRDASIMLEAMAGFDPKDATSVDISLPHYESQLTGKVRGLRVGIPKEYRVDGMRGEITDLWQKGMDWLKHEGAEIIDISLPHTKYALPTYYILAPAEASSNLARYDGVRYGHRMEGESLTDLYELTRGNGFGAEVQRRIMIGTYVLSAGFYDAYFVKAQRVRRLIAQDFENAFTQVDCILTPTTPTAAFSLDNPPTDPVEMYMNDVLAVPANLAGLPAISVPGGLTKDGLPLGLQLIGKSFDEVTLLNAAQAIEIAANFQGQVLELRKAS
ncbi:MAG: Asp-tRNA(Asn)/Glu-tRNA(Gln) amidotransferase subunit GatA [Alphaproteobacteria bacterium]|nr:Asp-tRNA(Asn)/Glu-tRNA(Gln) amidotransferase subunit GatA [Alphaproteobacteria bacterium]